MATGPARILPSGFDSVARRVGKIQESKPHVFRENGCLYFLFSLLFPQDSDMNTYEGVGEG
jgi:hypothetical protein